MSRIATTVLGGLLALTAASPASAHWWDRFWGNVHEGTHETVAWPKQYVGMDAQSVRDMMSVGVERGWQKQNLLGSHHFDESTNQLTTAGVARVKAILTYSPPQFRSVYVEKGNNPNITANRVDSVQQFIVSTTPQGSLPPVYASDLPYEGQSAYQADQIMRKYDATIPAPRLPASDDTGALSGAQ
ncbi:MAG: hypothetical protein SGJ20_16640 [Planctomycetota bacterium]|nr:hypothetical protein [Planctomycetota bacterium]